MDRNTREERSASVPRPPLACVTSNHILPGSFLGIQPAEARWGEAHDAILIDSDDEALLVSASSEVAGEVDGPSSGVEWCTEDTPRRLHLNRAKEEDGGGSVCSGVDTVELQGGALLGENSDRHTNEEEDEDVLFPLDDEEIEWVHDEAHAHRRKQQRRYFSWNSKERTFEEVVHVTEENEDCVSHSPHQEDSTRVPSEEQNPPACHFRPSQSSSMRTHLADISAEARKPSCSTSSSSLIAIPGFGLHVKGLPSWFAVPLTHPRTTEAVRELWKRVTRDLQAYRSSSECSGSPEISSTKETREDDSCKPLPSFPESFSSPSSLVQDGDEARDETATSRRGCSGSVGAEKENRGGGRVREGSEGYPPWSPTCVLEEAGYPSWVYLSSDVVFPSREHAREMWNQIQRDVCTLRLERTRRRQKRVGLGKREENVKHAMTEEAKKRGGGEDEFLRSERGVSGRAEEVVPVGLGTASPESKNGAKEADGDAQNDAQPSIIITGEKSRVPLPPQHERQLDTPLSFSGRTVHTLGSSTSKYSSSHIHRQLQPNRKAQSSEFVSRLLLRPKASPPPPQAPPSSQRVGPPFSAFSVLKGAGGGRDLGTSSARKAEETVAGGGLERKRMVRAREGEEEKAGKTTLVTSQKRPRSGTSLSSATSMPSQTAPSKASQQLRPGKPVPGGGTGVSFKSQHGGDGEKGEAKGTASKSRQNEVYVPLAERLRPAVSSGSGSRSVRGK